MTDSRLIAENNFLMYTLNSHTPLKLEINFVYCDKEITDYLHRERWYCDLLTKIIIMPNVTIDISVPDKRTMDNKFQYIEGFISGKSYLPYIVHFESEEIKQIYVNRLVSTLTHLVAEVANQGRAYGCTPVQRKLFVLGY